jgi:phenylacetic acid degradation protein
MNAVVMDAAVIGESSIVAAAAAAFVPAQSEVPPRSLVVGVPAKVVRPLTEQELAWKPQATATYQYLCRESHRSLVPCTPLTAPEPDRRRCRDPDVVPLSEFKRRTAAEQ